MFDKFKKIFKKSESSEPLTSEDAVISENLLNNKYNKGKYAPFYDHYHDVWAVKDTSDGVCHPMTSKNMAYEITILLNYYECKLQGTYDELYKKDRKFEDLGFDLDELDTELGISGGVHLSYS